MNCVAKKFESDGSLEARAIELARNAFELRRSRSSHLQGDLFCDPAWDILLLLYIDGGGTEPWDASRVAQAIDLPVSTTERWLRLLEHEALVQPFDEDNAATEFSITASGRTAMLDIFSRAL